MNTYKLYLVVISRKGLVVNRELFLVEGLLYLHPIPIYRMSLYADMPVSEFKKLFGDDCKYLFSTLNIVGGLLKEIYEMTTVALFVFYIVSEKDLEKNCKKSGLATYITGQNLHKWFLDIVILDTFFVRIFSEC